MKIVCCDWTKEQMEESQSEKHLCIDLWKESVMERQHPAQMWSRGPQGQTKDLYLAQLWFSAIRRKVY